MRKQTTISYTGKTSRTERQTVCIQIVKMKYENKATDHNNLRSKRCKAKNQAE